MAKDKDLPYVYLDDEDEPKRKKRKTETVYTTKRSASGASSTAKHKKELPYEYVDEDDERARPRKKSASSGSAKTTRIRSNELPYEYVDEGDESVKQRKKSAGRASSKRKKKSSAAPIILTCVMLVLVLCATVFLLDMNGVLKLGVWKAISGENDSGYSASGSGNTNGQTVNKTTPVPKSTSPDDWVNILLLGTDTRKLNEASRSDTIIICSINTVTGQVKLASIMRDTEVVLNANGKKGRINDAYFRGGHELALKVVNENFGTDISEYVVVNFMGFARVVDALGGVDLDIAQEELEGLNHNLGEQYQLMYKWGELDYEEAEAGYSRDQIAQPGKNLHLNGMQALAYARIRKTYGGDTERTNRQRKVLNALLLKVKGTDTATITKLFNEYVDGKTVKTNLSLSRIIQIAPAVLDSRNLEGAKDIYLPINGTYDPTPRNGVSMLYDVDFEENSSALNQFIYYDYED